jgi:L-ascorbate metabolism protein UlaG (beta-lactamase superfamily)
MITLRRKRARVAVGEVAGFALQWEGQRNGAMWLSGDTVLYEGVRRMADRIDVGTAVLHLGAVRFPITGPLHYTLNASEAVKLWGLMRPTTVVPIHYDGWSHFSHGLLPALALTGS